MRHSRSFPVPDGFVARLSIEHKLPAIIGGLLLLVIVALSAAAYVEARRSSLQVASDRLTSLTLQFRDLLQQQTAQQRALLITQARAPALADYAANPGPRLRDRALAALRSGPQQETMVATELRDGEGNVLLIAHAEGTVLDTSTARDVLPFAQDTDSAATGGLRAVRDTIIYPVVARIPGPSEAYLVRWRRIAGTRQARERLNRIIGADAVLLLGDPAGHWTDFERPVPPLPVAVDADLPVQTYVDASNGAEHMVAMQRVPGTPWVVAVDFPMANIMAPVATFVRRIAGIAVVALLLGLIAAWIMSRRITQPLRELTSAAVAIAGGDYTQRPRIPRSDELGQLGKAFGVMAKDVELSRVDLEHRVEERTQDLDQALRQLQDAQDALVRRERLALLGQLSSGVGHELRNPLGVMTNAVYYLRMVLTDAPQNVHEYLGILQQQITLSEKIVGDLLDFARSKPPRRQPTALGRVVDEQLGRLGAMNGTRVETDIPPDLPPALVDEVQLGQIVLNLLTNAAQALEADTGTIRITANANDHRVTLEVADTGPGIPRENIERVFEPLFTTKARGIGLGLAVSRTLARANGGELTATSETGKGATFRLTLPIADTEATL